MPVPYYEENIAETGIIIKEVLQEVKPLSAKDLDFVVGFSAILPLQIPMSTSSCAENPPLWIL